MISAITNRGHMQFMVFKERFTTAVFLKFLRRLLRQNRQKIFLIIDGHPVHIAKSTCRWFKEHRAAMRVYFLPGYSPELNPDEYLNQDVKTNAVGRTRPLDRKELIGNVRAYLRSTQAHRSCCQTIFSGKTCPLCFSVKYLTLPVIILQLPAPPWIVKQRLPIVCDPSSVIDEFGAIEASRANPK